MDHQRNLCRVCLEPEEDSKYLSIYSNNSKVAMRIFLISGVQVTESEDAPAMICHQCVKDLYHADLIRKKCLQGEEYFKSILTLETDTQGDSDHMKNTTENINDKEVCRDEYPVCEESNYESGASLECDKRKGRKTSLRNKPVPVRIKKPLDKEKFFCSKCFKSFSDSSYLKKHEYYRHFEIPQEDLLECDYCGHKTKTKQLIRNHINTVHSTKPKEKFICRICGKMLSTKGNLDGHEKTHLDIDPSEYVTCPVCKKAFKEKRFMVEHKKLVHEKSKAFQCPHCPHVSTCKGAYNKHFKSVHLKLRDFICSDCGLGFSTNSQLVRHFRIHTGERPYECTNCSKPFRLSSHRKRHEDICPKRLNK